MCGSFAEEKKMNNPSEVLYSEIEKLQEFVRREIVPNGILANNLNLLVYKLQNEYPSHSGNTTKPKKTITLKVIINSTNNVILSDVNEETMTTQEVFYKVQEVLDERILNKRQMKLLRNGNLLEIDPQITLQMCGICDRDILTFDFQSNENTKVSSSSISTSMELQDEPQPPAYPFILSIQRSGIVPSQYLESIALAAHAILLQQGFICICERETGKKPVAGFAQPLSELPRDRFVPPRWNTEADGLITFLYKHKTKPGKQFNLTCLQISENEVALNLIMKGSPPKPSNGLTLQIHSVLHIDALNNQSAALNQLYSNPSELEDQILSMIFETVPELRPRVATESTKPSQASSPPTNMTNPYPSPSNPPTNPAAPYNNPYGVGQGDLDPAFPPGPTGGGSLVGPDHPMFRGEGIPSAMYPPGYPQPRFDPLLPFGGNPMGGRNSGRGRGRGARRLPGEPGPDHLRPPGFNDDEDDMYF